MNAERAASQISRPYCQYRSRKGIELEDRMDSSLFDMFTTLGRSAAHEFNQVSDPYEYEAIEI